MDADYLEASYERDVPLRMDCADARLLYNPYFCEDSVDVLWKYEHPSGPVVCFVSSAWFAKGLSEYYVLAKYDAEYQLQDQLEVAASLAVAVENPFGGTSAGVAYAIGHIEDLFNIYIWAEGTSAEANKQWFIINELGKFEGVDDQSLNVSNFRRLELIDIVHNIDFVTWEFVDREGRSWDFHFQSAQLMEDSRYYYTIEESEESVVGILVAEDHVLDKWYKVEYQYQMLEMPLVGETDKHRILIDLSRID